MKHTPILILLLSLLLLMGCTSAPEDATSVPTTPATETLLPTTEATLPATTAPVTEAPTEPPEQRFLLTFVGDCTLGCTPEGYYAPVCFIKTVNGDYKYPFQNVLSYFENDEFTMVNLEGTLTKDGVRQQKSFTFLGPPDYVNILTENSVEAVTLANNHSWDFGEFGYITTKRTLDDAGIPYVETNDTAIFTTKNGLKIGVYGTVYYKMDMDDMLEGIAELKEQNVDLIVFAPHWGAEGYYYANEIQTEFAHAAIDAGADIVYGSHPHVLQPIETYGDGIICYSLGNFCFGGNSNPDDYDTVIFQQEVLRDAEGNVRLGETILTPSCLSSVEGRNNYQPTPYEPGSEDWMRVLSKLGQE